MNTSRTVLQDTKEEVMQACLLLEQVRISVMSNVVDALSTIVAHVWLRLRMRIISTIKITESIQASTILATSTTLDYEGHLIPALKSTES